MKSQYNPADANALTVSQADRASARPLLAGYLPRDLAAVLAPLLDAGHVIVECMVRGL